MASVYLYPVWVRLWHMVNALLFLILIVTGLSLQYSSPDYTIIRFDMAVTMHNVAGILLSLNYLVIFFGNMFTKNGFYYRMRRKWLKTEIPTQARYYLFGIFMGEKAPYPINSRRKFNPLQKVSYVAVLYFLMPLIFITGWALIFPNVLFVDKIMGTSSLHFTDLVHIIVGFILSIFMFVHIYLCTIGKPAGSHFKAMLSGWHHSDH
jgi:thiosulfate reductase cytochrome b subunit